MRILFFSLWLSVLSGTAFAACAALPSGAAAALRLGGSAGTGGVFGADATTQPAGTIGWDGAQNKPVYCDGTNWLQLASTAGGAGGSSTPEKIISNLGQITGKCADVRAAINDGKYVYMKCNDQFYYPKNVKNISNAELQFVVTIQEGTNYNADYNGSSYRLAVGTLDGLFRVDCAASTARLPTANSASASRPDNVTVMYNTAACSSFELWAR